MLLGCSGGSCFRSQVFFAHERFFLVEELVEGSAQPSGELPFWIQSTAKGCIVFLLYVPFVGTCLRAVSSIDILRSERVGANVCVSTCEYCTCEYY